MWILTTVQTSFSSLYSSIKGNQGLHCYWFLYLMIDHSRCLWYYEILSTHLSLFWVKNLILDSPLCYIESWFSNFKIFQLHHVDGLTHSGVRQLLDAKENNNEDIIPLMGGSGSTWGVAMRSTPDTLKPIFISVGHCISLDTAVMIVKMTCKYRVPEPIRQADIRSRDYLQKHQSTCLLQRWQWLGMFVISPCSKYGVWEICVTACTKLRM